LSTVEFAAWQRTRRLLLPYAIDLTGYRTCGVAAPADHPALGILQRVATQPRVSGYLLHAAPQGLSRTVVAVAGTDDAVLVAVDDDQVQVAEIGCSDLVVALAERLPDLVPLDVPAAELPEPAWAELVCRLSGAHSDSERRTVRAALLTRGLPATVVDAMLLAAAAPAVVGAVGVQVWSDDPGAFGPTLFSWQELPNGALATHLHAPRRPGPTRVWIGPYRRADVISALPTAMSTALYRIRCVSSDAPAPRTRRDLAAALEEAR
jgi:hypothetical protein